MDEKSTSTIIASGQYTITDLFDGNDSKGVSINGLTSFLYDSKDDTIPTPSSITLTANLQNISEYNINWQYKVSGQANYINIVSSSGCLISNDRLTLTLDDKACFTNILTEFKVIVTDTSVIPNQVYIATHSIGKIYGGIDSYTCILTNESDTILFNQDNTVKDGQIGSSTSKAFSSIIVKKGSTSLQAVGENVTPTVGQFKFKFEPTPTNCTAKRYGESSFYLDTIDNDAEKGKISIAIYLEGNTNKITKEYTWNKVIDGANAKYLVLEGEDKFRYDNLSDTTPTPTSITLTATAYNIPNPTYKWQYNNGALIDIVSGEGCIIENNKLTIDDKKLFSGNLKSVKIICSVTHNEGIYSDTKSIIKTYDGEQGPIGKPSKSVTISGGNIIHYDKANVANPNKIKLTATPYNYEIPSYKWYYSTSSGYKLISDQNSNILDVNHDSDYFINDIALIKVECSEANGTDKLFYEHTITKTYDGSDSPSLVLNIIEGTRNLCYNGKGLLVSTIISPFKIELYEDDINVTSTSNVRSITWSAKGHYSHENVGVGSISFRPTPINNYDESLLDTCVSVIVNYNGRIIKQSAPITVSKNSTALDWVEEWEGNKVEVNGNNIITPKIFAGKKDTQRNTITGVALGQDIVNKNNNIGMAIYCDNEIIGKINSNPSVDEDNMLVFGNKKDRQFIVKTDGSVMIGDNVTIGNTSVKQLQDTAKGGYNILKNSSFENELKYWNVLKLDNQVDGKHDIEVIKKTDKNAISNRNCIQCSSANLQDSSMNNDIKHGFYSDNFIINENTTYSFQCLVSVDNLDGATFELVYYDENKNVLESTSFVKQNINSGGKDRNNWTEVRRVFTTCEGAHECSLIIYMNKRVTNQTNAYMWICEPLIIEGDKQVAWIPSSDEIYSGITKIDKDGIKVTMSNGEGLQGYTELDFEGLSIYDGEGKRKAWFGQDDNAYVETLYVEQINANNIITKYNSDDIKIYVNTESTGNGSGLDIENKCGSIQDAINILKNNYGEYINSNVSILVSNGNYYEDIAIQGFLGVGEITIELENGVCVYGKWNISYNLNKIRINGNRSNNSTNDGAQLICDITANRTPHIDISNSVVEVSRIRAYNRQGNKYNGTFIQALNGSNVQLHISDISRYYYGIYVGSFASLVGITLSRGYVYHSVYVRYSSIATIAQGHPQAIEEPLNDYAGVIHVKGEGSPSLYDPDWENSESNPEPAPPTEDWQWVQKEFKLTNLNSNGNGASSRSGVMGQGQWGVGKGHIGTGSIPTSLVTFCNGARNVTMSCRMHRQKSAHGQYGAIPKPRILQGNGTYWQTSKAFALNDTHTFSLPVLIYDYIKNGSMKKLQIHSTTKNDYSFYDSVVIVVKCEKNMI